MPATPLLVPVAHWITCMRTKDVPDQVIHVASTALTDFVAVGIGGSQMAVSTNALKYVQTQAHTGQSVLFGTNQRVNAENAAFFNGICAHALDFDDVSWATIGHPTVAIAPTALAIAQELNCSGIELLKAYIVGVEVAHQIADWTMPALSENGWHTTLANGVFGACAAACYLRNYPETVTLNALGLAASLCCGLRANFGSQTKATHAGLSNLLGIKAAELAACGITSKPDVLEAPDGYAQCFAHPIDANQCHCRLGDKWDLLERGLVFKRYPCCSGSHPALDVWDEYLKKHPLSAENIASMKLGVSLLGPKELVSHQPKNSIEAKFSMEFALAARLIKGAITPATFTDEVVLDPAIQCLMSKMTMFVHPELEKLGFIGTAPVRLTIECKDGQQIQLSNDLARGNPEKPLSEHELHEKFHQCTSPYIERTAIEYWWNTLQNLTLCTPDDIRALGLK